MKETTVTFRIKVSLKEGARERAAQQEQTLSLYLTHLIERDLKKRLKN